MIAFRRSAKYLCRIYEYRSEVYFARFAKRSDIFTVKYFSGATWNEAAIFGNVRNKECRRMGSREIERHNAVSPVFLIAVYRFEISLFRDAWQDVYLFGSINVPCFIFSTHSFYIWFVPCLGKVGMVFVLVRNRGDNRWGREIFLIGGWWRRNKNDLGSGHLFMAKCYLWGNFFMYIFYI